MKLESILLTITTTTSTTQPKIERIVVTKENLDKTIKKIQKTFYEKYSNDKYQDIGTYTEHSKVFRRLKNNILEITAEPIKIKLTECDEDNIYRKIWYKHVIEDIKSRLEDTNETLTKSQIKVAAKYYVYDSDYDCNQSYWEQIDNVIKRAKKM